MLFVKQNCQFVHMLRKTFRGPFQSTSISNLGTWSKGAVTWSSDKGVTILIYCTEKEQAL